MPSDVAEDSNYFEDNLDTLISIEDLLLKVEIKSFENNYVIEFNKRSGDRLRFYNIFTSFVDSLN